MQDMFMMGENGEGGIMSEQDRIPMVSGTPTLIIGLGGTGVDALLRAKYEINRRFILPAGKEKPDDVEYLAIDTDETKSSEEIRGIKLDRQTEFCTISVTGLAAFLTNRDLIDKEYQKDWLSDTLTADGGMKGANGKRQVGRFMLFRNAEDVTDLIKRKIEAVYDRHADDVSMNVFIFSGISGGTGAGTFLDIAFIVREILNRINPALTHNVIGYLFLPDVNLAIPELPKKSIPYIKANGYASLKDLDYWMNAGDRNEAFVQRYTDEFIVNTSIWHNKMLPPFSMCHLISAQTIEGIKGPRAYEYAMSVVSESVISFISNEDLAIVNDQPKSSYQSFLDDLTTILGTQQKQYCGNHCYTIIGADARVLQHDDIINYVAFLLLKKVMKLWENVPSEHTIREFFSSTLGLSCTRAENEIKSGHPVITSEDLKKIDRQSVLDGLVDIERRMRGNLTGGETDIYPQKRAILLQDTVKTLKEKVEDLFADAAHNKGPYYAHKLLYSIEPGAIHLSKLISDARAESITKRREMEARGTGLSDKTRDAKQKAIRNRNNLLYSVTSYNNYLAAAYEEYDTLRRAGLYSEMVKFYEELQKEVTEYNNTVVESFVKILTALAEVFQNNANIMTHVSEVRGEHAVHYDWKIYNFAEIKPHLDAALQARGFDVSQGFADNFLKNILKNRTAFIGNEQDRLRMGSAISKHIEDQYGWLLGESLERQMAEKFGVPFHPESDGGTTEFINYVCDKLMPNIQRISQPMFALDEMVFPAGRSVQYIYASVPNVAPNLRAGVQKYASQDSQKQITVRIKSSHLNNRMFWLNSYNGIPLFAYSHLKDYENVYNSMRDLIKPHGRHLRLSAKEDWSLLPSPIHESTWRSIHKNPAEKDRCCEARRVFNEAMEKGLIQIIGTNGYFRRVSPEQAAGTDLNRLRQLWMILSEQVKDPDIIMLMHQIFGDIVDGADAGEQTLYQLRESFTRTPNIQKVLGEQLALYEQIQSSIRRREESDRFPEKLVYGAIELVDGLVYCCPGNGLYTETVTVFNMAAGGPWPFPLYSLFEKYIGLRDEQKAVIQKKEAEIAGIREAILSEPEAAKAILKEGTQRLIALMNQAAEAIRRIDRDPSFADPQKGEIRSFYQNLHRKLNAMASQPPLINFMV